MDWEELEDPKRLYKAFAFKNFRDALAFAQRVGELAERENHHPRLTVEWGRVAVEWWTHSAGGITEKDREMARLTDALYVG
jgi:4a-hydroxytetrahydrobiopterin dehydratase